jgi:IS4 transposase
VARTLAPGKRLRFKNKLFSLDATLIELCLEMFDWAKYRQTKGAIKLHVLLDHDGYLPVYAHVSEGKVPEIEIARALSLPKGSIVVMDRGYIDYRLFSRWTKEGIRFVTRLKPRADYVAWEDRPVPGGSNVRKDQLIGLNPLMAGAPCREDLRVVTVWDEENQREIQLLTNELKLSAATISAIYKERWQIELFFKALKQGLKIKTFVGTSANAVRTQIWTALIAMLLIKILQQRSTFAWALSNLIALLRWNLFTYRNLWEWINRPFDTPPETPPDQLALFDLDSIPRPT